MEDFVADWEYVSREVFKFIEELGLVPYIPFKKNARGTKQGVRIWKEMYDHFMHSREIFMEHYNARSNVETCFHILKTRFGNHLMTKNFNANSNEIKTRALCHNLCVLIQEAYELGVSLELDSVVAKAQEINTF